MAEFKFQVDASQIMLFARSVGDKNPIYHDKEYASGTEVGGIVAPPTFVQASAQYDPKFPLRPTIGEAWFGSGKEATGLKPKAKESGDKEKKSGDSARMLHAEQQYIYHKPIRPGDELTVTTKRGKSWEKEGRRGGTMSFSETITEFRDASGDLVVTATSVGVTTGKAVSQD
ncbi:MAG: MaoC family dehydratase N-terminal domain-containing protein [Gammaproteobacteria bacterium]|nr:MaoC family dehydratase N-terminal domain-containing protein [Gammaproteobacteria bacterium]MBQ0840177.1 MaoC family dehydratase N-terminal domain-containing protein [Gammaproteobacteria bacterium]